jgi:hypothetical protein
MGSRRILDMREMGTLEAVASLNGNRVIGGEGSRGQSTGVRSIVSRNGSFIRIRGLRTLIGVTSGVVGTEEALRVKTWETSILIDIDHLGSRPSARSSPRTAVGDDQCCRGCLTSRLCVRCGVQLGCPSNNTSRMHISGCGRFANLLHLIAFLTTRSLRVSQCAATSTTSWLLERCMWAGQLPVKRCWRAAPSRWRRLGLLPDACGLRECSSSRTGTGTRYDKLLYSRTVLCVPYCTLGPQ